MPVIPEAARLRPMAGPARPTEKRATDLLRPYDAEAMRAAPCNPKVGNVRNNGPEMIGRTGAGMSRGSTRVDPTAEASVE